MFKNKDTPVTRFRVNPDQEIVITKLSSSEKIQLENEIIARLENKLIKLKRNRSSESKESNSNGDGLDTTLKKGSDLCEQFKEKKTFVKKSNLKSPKKDQRVGSSGASKKEKKVKFLSKEFTNLEKLDTKNILKPLTKAVTDKGKANSMKKKERHSPIQTPKFADSPPQMSQDEEEKDQDMSSLDFSSMISNQIPTLEKAEKDDDLHSKETNFTAQNSKFEIGDS